MSFGSILGSIAHGLEVGIADALPFVGIAAKLPFIGAPAQTIFTVMNFVEGLLTASGSGATRKVLAIQLINAVHPGLDQAALGSVIDGIVAGVKMIEEQLGKLPASAPLAKAA